MTLLFPGEGFPGGSDVENMPSVQETLLQFLSQEDSPGEENGY